MLGYKNPKNKTVKISGASFEEKLNFKCKGILGYLKNNKKIEFIEYTTRDHAIYGQQDQIFSEKQLSDIKKESRKRPLNLLTTVLIIHLLISKESL